MRVSQHNARCGKDGVFSVKHNDRNFDVENANHINAGKSQKNEYFCWCGDGFSFEDAEKKFYEEHFAKALDLQNEKYKKARQYKRIRTLEDYRTDKKTCPEEQIIQLGNVEKHCGVAMLKQIVNEQLKWEREQFPNAIVLDVALHVDEATPHVHIRKVWLSHDANGNEVVSQTKALSEMGITVAKATRYNNAKKIYTEACRKHFEGLCRKYGIQLEAGRLEASKTHLDTLQYQVYKEHEKLIEAKRNLGFDRLADGVTIGNLRKKVAELEKLLEKNGINPNEKQNGKTPYRGR